MWDYLARVVRSLTAFFKCIPRSICTRDRLGQETNVIFMKGIGIFEFEFEFELYQ